MSESKDSTSKISSLTQRIKLGDPSLDLYDNNLLWSTSNSLPSTFGNNPPIKHSQSLSSVPNFLKEEPKRGSFKKEKEKEKEPKSTILLTPQEKEKYKRNALLKYMREQFENTAILNSRSMQRSNSLSYIPSTPPPHISPALSSPSLPTSPLPETENPPSQSSSFMNQKPNNFSKRALINKVTRPRAITSVSQVSIITLHLPSKFIIDENLTERVFSFLTFEDLVSASQVCRKWNKILQKRTLWEKLFYYHLESFQVDTYENIWQDKTLPTPDSPLPIESSKLTLNQLVVRLTPTAHVPDETDLSATLMTYKTFTTSLQLIIKLIQRYYVPHRDSEEWTKNVVRPIQLRVVRVLKQMLEDHFTDLGEREILLLKIFIRGMMEKSEICRTLRNAFAAKTIKKKDLNVDILSVSPHPTVSRKKLKTKLVKNGTGDSILDYQPWVIAEQLTLIEFEYFKMIEPEGLINPEKENSKTKQMINHFNDISRWIVDSVLECDKYRQRARRMEYFIKIADELRQLNNYETMMAIISSLNEPSLFRLRHTRSEIKSRSMNTLNELHAIMHPEKSYRKYRGILNEVSPPCIPYIGIDLRDIIYFEEGSTSRGSINFNKKLHTFGIISRIQNFQQVKYKIEPLRELEEKLKKLEQLTIVDHEKYKDHWHQRSLQLEPRDCKKSEIQ